MRFDQQVDNAEVFVVPFIEKTLPIHAGIRVLEIGCGEGGVLKPFVNRGCECVGVDLDQLRIDLAHEFLKDDLAKGHLHILYKNVFDDDFKQQYAHYFDLIILKDVIEHIHGQEVFIPFMKTLLREDGQIFFGFPPWYMPFGGHQQSLDNKFLQKLPYYHLLPDFIYRGMMKMGGESEGRIRDTMEVKETQISINRFEKISKNAGFEIVKKEFYLINPSYKHKFGATPRKQFNLLSAIPILRDFFTTTCYYILKKS